MRRTSDLTNRLAMVCSAMVLAASGVASAENLEPAQLVTLSGDAAAELQMTFSPAVPVLVAGAGENVVAIVFDENPEEARTVLESLFSDAPVEGCSLDGAVACCDTATGEMVLSVSYGGRRGWAQLGQQCDAIATKDGYDLVPLSEEVSQQLAAQHQVDSCFMEMVYGDGTPFVLVNAPSRESSLWIYCLKHVMDATEQPRHWVGGPSESGPYWLVASLRQRLPAMSPIIPARHHGPPPAPCILLYDFYHIPYPGVNPNNYRCHYNSRHWFRRDGTVSYTRWICMSPGC